MLSVASHPKQSQKVSSSTSQCFFLLLGFVAKSNESVFAQKTSGIMFLAAFSKTVKHIGNGKGTGLSLSGKCLTSGLLFTCSKEQQNPADECQIHHRARKPNSEGCDE